MPRNYTSAPQFNGNLLCAIDFETSGGDEQIHELLQIAIVPLGHDYEPVKGLRPFYTTIAPMHPETADPEATKVHGLDINELCRTSPSSDQVADMLVAWYEQLELVFDRRIIPLCHNAGFEFKFLSKWLGHTLMSSMFASTPRDAMVVATFINDMAIERGGKAPFERVSNSWLCNHYGIVNDKAHDALHDCLATAKVYKKLLQEDVLL